MRREGYSSCLARARVRACVRACVCVCVCLYVCLSEHAILAVRAIISITKDAIVLSVRFAAILKGRFSLNCLACVCVCVCLYVCLSEHAILAVRAIISITKDAIVLSVRFAAILKGRFSLNCLI